MSRAPQFPDDFFKVNFHNAARHAADNRECIRLLGLALLQQSYSVKETAECLSVTKDAVHDWLRRFKQGGLEAMKDQGGRGRKKCLPITDEEAFKQAVLKAQQQKDNGNITGNDIKQLLEKEFGVTCGKTAVYGLLHRVGLSWMSARSPRSKQSKTVNSKRIYKSASAENRIKPKK